MVTDPNKVREMLVYRIRCGYSPYWDAESSDDHGVDWQTISCKEFRRITTATSAKLRKVA